MRMERMDRMRYDTEMAALPAAVWSWVRFVCVDENEEELMEICFLLSVCVF